MITTVAHRSNAEKKTRTSSTLSTTNHTQSALELNAYARTNHKKIK
jgi:hypothetical protein